MNFTIARLDCLMRCEQKRHLSINSTCPAGPTLCVAQRLWQTYRPFLNAVWSGIYNASVRFGGRCARIGQMNKQKMPTTDARKVAQTETHRTKRWPDDRRGGGEQGRGQMLWLVAGGYVFLCADKCDINHWMTAQFISHEWHKYTWKLAAEVAGFHQNQKHWNGRTRSTFSFPWIRAVWKYLFLSEKNAHDRQCKRRHSSQWRALNSFRL